MDNSNNFQEKAKHVVYGFANSLLTSKEKKCFNFEDVYVVWFCKTLQNWKALVSTTLPDGIYYEVTYNGDKREIYLDAYKKFKNICIDDSQVTDKK